MRVVLTSGLTGLALLQSGSCGANVQNKYLGQLLPGPGRSSITTLFFFYKKNLIRNKGSFFQKVKKKIKKND